MPSTALNNVEIIGDLTPAFEEILTPEALAFVASFIAGSTKSGSSS